MRTFPTVFDNEMSVVNECKTIPELLVLNYGNISDAARFLDADRSRVRRLARDTDGDKHRLHLVNGRLKLFTTK